MLKKNKIENLKITMAGSCGTAITRLFWKNFLVGAFGKICTRKDFGIKSWF